MSQGSLGSRHYESFRNPDKIEEGGIINLSGAFLLDHEEEIVNLVKHEGKLATERNSKARVSKIAKANGGLIIETTDHNLALRIGKAIHHAYKGDHQYKFLKDEKFVQVDWKRD